ncbi:prepilin-type N-terminal cleavage/methylation domain-containing protein [Anatilimnocola floriformis]|uniref:prepilin-type N-terminal cleavage/methylation domain-containing protein n=1 Tax=Anatilimnocola floriformis TaxID=2948575 RepID=UPI0020C4EDBC|nr:prepilin-type N-terminal cleavage/methylation domain-containing protein [Anatilimnocola floriformis]
MNSSSRHRGLTLLELIVVITILAVLAGLVVVSVSSVMEDSREQLTWASLREVQKVIVNRYQIDMAGKVPGPDPQNLGGRQLHPQLHFLFVNPSTSTFDPISGLGWRGPYMLTSSAGRYPGLDPDENAVSRGFTAIFGKSQSDPPTPDADHAVLDSWGRPIILRTGSSSDVFELVSAGPDGVLGTHLAPGDDLIQPLQ